MFSPVQGDGCRKSMVIDTGSESRILVTGLLVPLDVIPNGCVRVFVWKFRW